MDGGESRGMLLRLSEFRIGEVEHIVIKLSERLEFASWGSCKWLKSMTSINGYCHLEESRVGERGYNTC